MAVLGGVRFLLSEVPLYSHLGMWWSGDDKQQLQGGLGAFVVGVLVLNLRTTTS